MERYLEANPSVVLREEFDNWAVLFDPETGAGFGLNPVGVFVWRRLDGRHTLDEIFAEMRMQFADVPEEGRAHLDELVKTLVDKGLVGEVLRHA